MQTKFILEYRYEEEDDWRFDDEFYSLSDAQHAYIGHIKSFNFIRIRVRRVKYVEESRIIGEYAALDAGDNDE